MAFRLAVALFAFACHVAMTCMVVAAANDAKARVQPTARVPRDKQTGEDTPGAPITPIDDVLNETTDADDIEDPSGLGKVRGTFQMLRTLREEVVSLNGQEDGNQTENLSLISDNERSPRVQREANYSIYPESLDSRRVAPLSSRLLNDSIPLSNSEEIDENFIARFWWVNSWARQQLQEPEEDESIPDVVNVSSDLANETSDAQVQVEVESEPEVEPEDMGILSEVETFPSESNNSQTENKTDEIPSFVSSGIWGPLDYVLTFGLVRIQPSFRPSTALRGTRKYCARVTGLHGLLSGKPTEMSTINPPARQRPQQRQSNGEYKLDGYFSPSKSSDPTSTDSEYEEKMAQLAETEALRRARVKEIDRLISKGQAQLEKLVCEKDVLQRRPNPLYDYTVEVQHDDAKNSSLESLEGTSINYTAGIDADRTFNFPHDDLVDEYLDVLFSGQRGLQKMNHTRLWQSVDAEMEEEDSIGDDLFTPSADARKLYEGIERNISASKKTQRGKNGGGGGSWLLRQTLGKGPSIGEKIGEVAEIAAYKATCGAVMSALARALSSLHGINVMTHSDIRLVLEQAPDLPRVRSNVIPGSSSDYAQRAIRSAMQRTSRPGNGEGLYRNSGSDFVQRDALTETLLSHVQISAPLLKLFPIAWQRAFLGNIITLCTAVMSDFFEGLEFQILGHSLTFSLRPITGQDVSDQVRVSMVSNDKRRAKAEEFEAAVSATAADVSDELKFLDRWHERALGSGVLRTQIAHLIARIVLTLIDDLLHGARMDLWSAQAGGPRLLAALEHRQIHSD